MPDNQKFPNAKRPGVQEELVSALLPSCDPCLPRRSDQLTIHKIEFTDRSHFFMGNSPTATSKKWEDTDLLGNKTLTVGQRKQQQPASSVHARALRGSEQQEQMVLILPRQGMAFSTSEQ